MIASLNSNGYVREKAIKKLSASNSEKAIQFIIYRLADWVQPVRSAALNGLDNFKKPQFINSFVDNLSIFKWLQKVERIDLSSVYNGVIYFILSTNKEFVSKNFSTFSDKTRLLLARDISSSPDIRPTELRLLLHDKHFLIRNFALKYFGNLSEDEINKLLKDKSSRVRMQVLYKLKNRSDFSYIIRPFLTDQSASVREFARVSLKNEIVDFATIYNDNLQNTKDILASIYGLAETNGKQFSESLYPFLKVIKIKIKKGAFLALTKLDKLRAYDFAIANLDSEFVGIRNVCIKFLQENPGDKVLEKARNIYKCGKYEHKKAMLKLFSKIGGWSTIADIMNGTMDENENIRNLSFEYLKKWKADAVRLFTRPQADYLDRAMEIFGVAIKMHENNTYFKENLFADLDFYFR